MTEDIDDIQVPDPIITKPSRGERLKRSVFARLRRKEVKQIKSVHQTKIEKEAEKRLKNN
jgi:hypothetical protein